MPLFFEFLTSLKAEHLQSEATQKSWCFYSRIGSLSAQEYNTLVANYPLLSLEYSLFCANLSHLLIHNRISKEALVQKFESILMMAQILFHLNLHYLDSPKDAIRLSKEIHSYRECLDDLAEYTFEPEEADVFLNQNPKALSVSLINLTGQINPSRILFIRARRFVLMLANTSPISPTLKHYMLNVDRFIAPILPTLSWLCFVPRLFTNLFLLAKHRFEHTLMLETEKKIEGTLRFKAMFDKNWFETANDVVWFTGAVLNVFVLVGPWAPYAFWNSFSMQVFDIFLAYFRMTHALEQLDTLKRQYQQHNIIIDELNAPHFYIHFQARYDYEKIKFMQGIYTAMGLTIALIFLIPNFALIPYFPIIGAAIAVSMTIFNRVRLAQIETTRPNDNLMSQVELNRKNIGIKEIEPAYRISQKILDFGLFRKELKARGYVSETMRSSFSQSAPNLSTLHPQSLGRV